MSLKIVNCNEPTIECFHSLITLEGAGKVRTLGGCKRKRNNSIVLGKIAKVISIGRKLVTLLAREVLPTGEYAQKFPAFIYGDLAVQLAKRTPEAGDRLAFFEPVVEVDSPIGHKDYEENKTKYQLKIGFNKESLMWFAKKKCASVTSTSRESKQNKMEIAHNNPNQNDTSKQVNKPLTHQQSGQEQTEVTVTEKSNKVETANKVIQIEVKNMSAVVRQKPHIQLPLKPQIPFNTKRLNPRYKYKKIADIKSKAISGDLERVNMFAVIDRINKHLTTTSTGKFTIICKIIDDSSEWMVLHLFTVEDTILKQIEEGDVLRLHRVKMELFNDDVDGRIFFSNDMLLFKKNGSVRSPITVAKNFQLPDEDKKKVVSLKKWYKELIESELDGAVLLADICKEGAYMVMCKVLSEPEIQDTKIIMKVTDGSETEEFTPSLPLQRYTGHGPPPAYIVTTIEVFSQNTEFSVIKEGDFVFLDKVTAVKKNDSLQLIINNPASFKILDQDLDKVLEMKRRLPIVEKEIIKIDDDKEVYYIGSKKISENLSTNQNRILPNSTTIYSTDQNDDDLSQTINGELRTKFKEQENKLRSSPCVNKTSVKPVILEKESNKKDKDVEPDTGKAELKIRKKLFTAGLSDLSVAKDISDIGAVTMKIPGSVIVSPANTSFGDLMELAKIKYCSPRRLDSAEKPKVSKEFKHSTPIKKDVMKGKIVEHMEHMKSAMVKLEKIDENMYKKCSSNEKLKNENNAKNSNRRKRLSDSIEQNKSAENLENASTVMNISLRKNERRNTLKGNKRSRLDSDSTELMSTGSKTEAVPKLNILPELSPEDRQKKVSNWLCHPKNIISEETDLEEDEDLGVEMIQQVLLGQDPVDPDMTDYISSISKNMRVFLVEVVPDHTKEPLDLVSGYCFSGCQQIYLLSTIHWNSGEESHIPLCPSCIHMNQEKELELMFMFELHLMDTVGYHSLVLACREHAETFLSCSVKNFLQDEVIRRSRLQMLSDCTIQQTLHSHFTPLLNISVGFTNDIPCLVNTKLQLPYS